LPAALALDGDRVVVGELNADASTRFDRALVVSRERSAHTVTMDLILEELAASIPDARQAVRVAIRLLAALFAGAIIGYQRERAGKAAGLRTHMLVSMGTAMFVVAAAENGMQHDALSRVMQGLVTGIGFLGAGAILKVESERRIRGLTTAAGIWMTAALGVAIGLGHLGTAAVGVAFSWVVLASLIRLEKHIDGSSTRA
jgi:putative Mg2+ transporter-C (MgtC) family protein